MRSLLVALAAAPILASAQQVHTVIVGSSSGETKFTPEAIAANPGDIVSFQFQQKNHSVVQSSLAEPCGAIDGGFNTGFWPVPPEQTSDFPVYNITVMDDKPIWVHCAQTVPVSHCGKGMVFAVNCGPDGAPNSFTNFKAAAIATASAPPDSSSSTSTSAPDAPPPSGGDATAAPPPSGTDPSAPPASSSTTGGNDIKVVVGGNGTLTYNPTHVTANIGDTITFEFQSKNHTVTQSTFADPCKKMVNPTTQQPGFDSGFMPVTAGQNPFPTYTITVNSSDAIWVYCKQRTPVDHCGTGMVFAVNTNESSNKTYADFANLAKQKNGTDASATGGGSGTDSTNAPDNSGALKTSISALSVLSVVGVLMLV